MSLDLSWIWSWLQSVVDTINNFFNQLWSAAQNITNTGQGLFAGLSALGSMLWDSLKRIGDAFNWIGDKLREFGNYIYNGIREFGEWIWRTLGNIGNAIYGAFQWIWNGIYWIGQQITLFLTNAWNWIADTMENISNTINNWIGGFIDTINQWWTNQIKLFREKLVLTLKTDLMIYFTWKTGEKFIENPTKEGFGKLLAMPFISLFFGELFGAIVDAVVPRPQTNTFQLIPPVSVPPITLPRLSYETVAVPAPPAKPPAPVYGYGLPLDIYLDMGMIITSYEARTFPGKDIADSMNDITTDYEANVLSGKDIVGSMNDITTSYELEVS